LASAPSWIVFSCSGLPKRYQGIFFFVSLPCFSTSRRRWIGSLTWFTCASAVRLFGSAGSTFGRNEKRLSLGPLGESPRFFGVIVTLSFLTWQIFD
jgi:hypothetical protein